MLQERISAFVRGGSGESFAELALETFGFRYQRDEVFRASCDRLSASPERVADWREVPALPASALEGAAPAHQPGIEPPYPDLLRAVIDRSFAAACLEGLDRPPVLSLVSADEDGDLPLLAERVLEAWAAPESVVAVARRGVEAAKARGFLAARQRDRRPTLILATPATARRLLDTLERRGLRFRLPPGSRLLEAGGAPADDPELLERLLDALALPAEEVRLAYGVRGLTSRIYAGRNRRGELQPLRPPPWVRARVLDPETAAELPAGTEGVLALFDLAAVGAGCHLLTGDLAVAEGDGFRLSTSS